VTSAERADPADPAQRADPAALPEPTASQAVQHQLTVHRYGTPGGGPLADAEALAADLRTTEQPLGRPGRRFDRRSPFFLGLAAAAGVAVTYGAVQALVVVHQALTLAGSALFLAVGLEPVVSWLVRHHLPRWAAVTVVYLTTLLAVVAFLSQAVPPLVDQATQLVDQAPGYLAQAQDHSSSLGRVVEQLNLQQRLTDLLNSSSLVDSLLGAGVLLFNAVTNLVLLAVLTAYFLVDLPRIRAVVYRLVPGSRRPRAILIGDEILDKVGGYVLGNVIISVIAAAATFAWLEAADVPYPLLLAIFVAVFDLVPVVGSTVAGVVVAAVALTVSPPACVATVAFFVVYRLVEDYLLVPRIIGRAVQVPALVTVVAVIIGAALLGVVGALVAIPVAAAVQLLAKEILFPWLDEA
jgi:predicted PurR-regulated permease PerM